MTDSEFAALFNKAGFQSAAVPVNTFPAHVSGIPAMDAVYVFTNMNQNGEPAEIPAQPPMWWPVRNIFLAPNTSLRLMGDGTLVVSVREEPAD